MRAVRIYHSGRESAHRERDRALAEMGVDLTLVVPSVWPGVDELTQEPYEITEFRVTRAGDVNRHRFVDPDAVVDLVRRIDPDVVDLHEEPFSRVVHQMLRRLPSALPIVTYAAQNIDKRFPPPFAQWEQQALARIDGIYPCSNQAASVVTGKGFTGAVEVLPLASSSSFVPGRQHLPADPVRLLLVGRLVPEKGVLDAVRATAMLSKRLPARLTLIGEGPEELPARNLADELDVTVDVLPWMSSRKLAEHYRNAHLLLAPSRSTATWVEQYGRMVTEAQASGVVVVAYGSGSLPEVVGDAGVLVPTGDRAALGEAVADLVAKPERWRELREAGFAAARGASWEAVAAGQLRLYERALQPRVHVPVRPNRPGARARFGHPAETTAGTRPFAVPILRDHPMLSRPLGAVADFLARRDSRDTRPHLQPPR